MLVWPSPVLDQGGQVFNVKSEGALGDGPNAGDDTSAFSRVLTKAAARPSGTVFIPPGLYPISSLLTVGAIGSGLTIRGSGPGSTVLQATPGLTGSLLAIINALDVEIWDLTIDMNWTATTKAASPANQAGLVYEATVAGVDGFRLHNVQVINGWHYGLYGVGASGQRAADIGIDADCRFSACGQAAGGSDAAVYLLNLDNVDFAAKVLNNLGLAAALTVTGCTDVELAPSVRCMGNAGQGCAFSGTAASLSTDLRVKGGKYSNNAGTYGLVFSQYTSHINASGGQSRGQSAGGGLGVDLTVTAGTLYDAEAVISGWEASNNGVHGIYLNNLTGVNLKGVIASNNGSDGIGAVVAHSVLEGILASGNTGAGLALYVGNGGVATGGNKVGAITGTGNGGALVTDATVNPNNYMSTSTAPPAS